jgi:hypothetical protein
MKLAILCVCLLACSQGALLDEFLSGFKQRTDKFLPPFAVPFDNSLGMDWKNSSYNVSQFMQGFAMGAYDERVQDLTYCVNDTLDLGQTLIRDFKPILNGTSLERAAAISDLIWHLVRDIPDALESCGHIGNKTMDIIHITEALFRDLKDFKHVLHKLVHVMGPVVKYVTTAAFEFELGNWYNVGLNIGYVFKAVLEESWDP